MTDTTICVGISLSAFAFIKVQGPRERLNYWLDDPDLPLTVPGFQMQPASIDGAPQLLLREAGEPRISEIERRDGMLVEGDLTTLTRRDFRRLLTHVAKVAVEYQGGALVHAACVVSPRGSGALIAGPQGSGKSTLALTLTRRGYRILATDVTLLDSHAHAISGTRHVTVYPHLLRNCRPDLAELVSDSLAAQHPSNSKLLVPTRLLEQQRVFYGDNQPLPIHNLFRVTLHANADSASSRKMNAQDKLATSLVLAESWANSAWLCPSWNHFLPRTYDDASRQRRQSLALKLADVPHWTMKGNFDAAADIIDELSG